jgi:hypothetical protein
MRATASGLCIGFFLASASAWTPSASAQALSSTQRAAEATSPDYSAVYCSSMVSNEKMPDDMRLISGEGSNVKIMFSRGDFVYLNKGSNQGVKVGDRFYLVRPEKDPDKVQWFKWQDKLLKAMGTVYKDSGQIEVTAVQPNVSTARVTFTCDYIQRGDIIRPMQERPTPPYKPSGEFEHFAPVSGKSVGMLVLGQQFTQLYGKDSIVYANLGTNQGVKVGDYLRVFRYQGTMAENLPNEAGYQYKLLGFGSTPVRYKWNDLPREVLGEGIVINVTPNSSTIFITYSRIEMYAGDYVEIE